MAAAVLLPASLVVFQAERFLLAEADGIHAIGGDSKRYEIFSHGGGATVAEAEVVFGRAALVAVTLDGYSYRWIDRGVPQSQSIDKNNHRGSLRRARLDRIQPRPRRPSLRRRERISRIAWSLRRSHEYRQLRQGETFLPGTQRDLLAAEPPRPFCQGQLSFTSACFGDYRS